MDKLHVKHSVNWLMTGIADHLGMMAPDKREVCVWAVLYYLVDRYRRVTGMTNDDIVSELKSVERERPSAFESSDAEYANYHDVMRVFSDMLGSAQGDDETIILFEVIRRLAPMHCQILNITYARMLHALDRFVEQLQETPHAVGDAAH